MKYDIKNEFGFFKNFIPPFSNGVVGFWGKLIKNSYKVLKKDKDVIFQSYDLGGFNVYFVKPKNQNNIPCILYLHGGAFVFPAYKSHYTTCLKYLKQAKTSILFVDYRLAPKNKYPSGENDCKKALDWLYGNAETLSVNDKKIGVAGDSAGGNLAAKLSVYAKKAEYPLKCQAFIYPVVDPFLHTESIQKFTDTPMWNAKLNEKMWRYYFGEENYENKVYENILDGEDLSDCPAFLEVCEFDCLKDEGLNLGNKLLKNGTTVTTSIVKGAMHGFDIKNCKTTDDAVEKRVGFFKSVFYDET